MENRAHTADVLSQLQTHEVGLAHALRTRWLARRVDRVTLVQRGCVANFQTILALPDPIVAPANTTITQLQVDLGAAAARWDVLLTVRTAVCVCVCMCVDVSKRALTCNPFLAPTLHAHVPLPSHCRQRRPYL